MSKIEPQGVQQQLIALRRQLEKKILKEVRYEQTSDGLLAYVPVPFTKYAAVIYPSYDRVFPTVEFRTRAWALYDFADHAPHGEDLLKLAAILVK
jgi:hypothetical protein